MSIANVRIPQGGSVALLQAWLDDAARSPLLAHLYESNTPYTPTRILADYTESAWTGYAPVVPSWSTVVLGLTGKAESGSGPLIWTFSGSTGTFPVYGIYFTDSADTILLAVAPFLVPRMVSTADANLAYSALVSGVSEL